MEALHTVSEKLLKYSTPFGHIWVAITFLCRLIPLATIGDNLYADEQDNFECITTQPGCGQMCYNLFAPMSLVRFWGMQILITCFPSLIFSMIAANYNAKYNLIKGRVTSNEKEASGNGSIGASSYVNSALYLRDTRLLRKYKKKVRKNVLEETTEELIWAPGMRMWYMIHLFGKLVLELFFVWALYVLQVYQNKKTGFFEVWTVPYKYQCTFGGEFDNWACSQDESIPCWVSRPWEKKIFLLYMTFMSFCSVVVVTCDFFYVIHKISAKKIRRRKQKQFIEKQMTEEKEELFPISENIPSVEDKQV